MPGKKTHATATDTRGMGVIGGGPRGAAYPKGTPVHVVLGTHLAQPFFGDCRLAEAVHSLVCDHQRTLATCLMPDHLHWLLDDSSKMRRAVGSFRSYSTRVVRHLGHKGKLWQRSYWNQVVRFEADVPRFVGRIVGDPVRRGLVEDWREYPYTARKSGPA